MLQQRAAVREPSGGPRGAASLLLRLARRPVWIGGILADGLGFAAQAGALAVLAPAIATASVGVAASILALGVMFAGLVVLARSEGARQPPDAAGDDAAR